MDRSYARRPLDITAAHGGPDWRGFPMGPFLGVQGRFHRFVKDQGGRTEIPPGPRRICEPAPRDFHPDGHFPGVDRD
jgi:hypothetical protein